MIRNLPYKQEVEISREEWNKLLVGTDKGIPFVKEAVVHITNPKDILNENYVIQRSSLKDLLGQLPPDQFIQTHRSFAINIKRVSHWDTEYIYFNDKEIPVSRNRRKEVFSLLKLR